MMHDKRDVMFGAHTTKMIVWCHNFLTSRELTAYARCQNVTRLIAVGREQMDLYRDHRAFLKSDYIYNCVDIPDYYLSKKKKSENILLYTWELSFRQKVYIYLQKHGRK